MAWIYFDGLVYYLLTSDQLSSRFGWGLEDSTHPTLELGAAIVAQTPLLRMEVRANNGSNDLQVIENQETKDWNTNLR